MFEESQIYRIDHYLGKETVQNLMALRFANALFEPVWNRNYIDHVQIVAAEDIGIGSRAGYYDRAGALRDLVQNHMLQLLALLAMEPPTAFNADQLRDEKLKVLEAIVPPSLERRVRGWPCAPSTGRASSAASASPATWRRTGSPPDSRTETYAALRLARLQLALGGRAVLPAHRQAARAQADRDRGDPQAGPACRLPEPRVDRHPGQPDRLHAAARRGRLGLDRRQAPRAPGCRSARSTWSSATAPRSCRSRPRPTSG